MDSGTQSSAVLTTPALRSLDHETGAELRADAGIRLLIAEGGASETAAAIGASQGIPLVLTGESASERHHSFEALLRSNDFTVAPAPVNPAEDVAVILYTGGTTGESKGARLIHRNLVANTIQFAEWYAFQQGAEICIGAIPMFHSGGMSGVMNVPLYSGAIILAFRRFQPETVSRAVADYRATRLFGVPTMFIALLNNDEARGADYGSLRACRTNAAPLPVRVKTAFDELVGREVIIEGYGLTETSPLTHANPPHRAKPGSIGIPLPDTQARVIHLKTGADLPADEAGELVIRGPQVMKAYRNRPDETARTMDGGWLHTGDVARMDNEGYFAIVDRLKDQINTAGFKIWPREVEEVLYTHPSVRQAVVYGKPDDYRGEIVKACVVTKGKRKSGVSEADIVAFCGERLAGYKVPREVEFRDDLPITATGKVLRRLLRDESN